MISTLTIRNLRANMGRFAMTTFGVVIAVSFVVSAFVLSDGLRKTFNDLSTDIVASTDFEIRPVETFGSTEFLDDDDVATLQAVDGVAMAIGSTSAPENSVRPITAAGEEIPSNGPPQLAFSWVDAPGLSPLSMVDGSPPGVDEFVIDLDSAAKHGFVIGDTYTVVSSTGRHELTLSGLTKFGEDNATVGATLMSMNADQTDQLFGTVGFDSIAIAMTNSGRADLAGAEAAIRAAVPELDVLTQASLADETAAEFNTQIDIIQYVLLGFAGISLLVSIFIIGNTFAIVLQQRTREMGLLRLVGADAKQLRRGALGEAGVIGLLASAIGIPGGIGVATGLTALFTAIGVTLPEYDLTVAPRTIGVALLVGLGVTLIAAWWPTRKATQVPAIAALRSGESGRTESGPLRLVAGLCLGVVGMVIAGLGVAGNGSTSAMLTMMGVGALMIFVAVTTISPRLVAPVASSFGLVLERLGMPGSLAVRNARRQAGRTATTATALMIGLAVVSMALVVGQSIKSQIGSNLETAMLADYLLTDQAAEAGFPTAIVEEIDADPTFDAVTGFRVAEMQVDDEIVDVIAARFGHLPTLFDLDVTEGAIDGADDSVLVSRARADLDAIAVGDAIDVTLETGVATTLNVSAIFDNDAVVTQDWVVDVDVFDRAGVTASDLWLAFSVANGVDSATATTAVEALAERYPQGELETSAQFQERVEGLVDQILSVMNALVALAVIIALIGIANTLALSVSERTREIGLLRAVGMSGRGVRRMIRYESAVIAGFGAVLGVAMGIGLGWLTVEALPDTFAGSISIPVGQILVLVAVAAGAGLIAALLPARRAGAMNVLAAISSQ